MFGNHRAMYKAAERFVLPSRFAQVSFVKCIHFSDMISLCNLMRIFYFDHPWCWR